MAEQVVDIRQRIERMRTQIDHGASPSQDNLKTNEKNISKKGNLENQKDLRPSDKNTSDNFLKKSDSLENKKTEFMFLLFFFLIMFFKRLPLYIL